MRHCPYRYTPVCESPISFVPYHELQQNCPGGGEGFRLFLPPSAGSNSVSPIRITCAVSFSKTPQKKPKTLRGPRRRTCFPAGRQVLLGKRFRPRDEQAVARWWWWFTTFVFGGYTPVLRTHDTGVHNHTKLTNREQKTGANDSGAHYRAVKPSSARESGPF